MNSAINLAVSSIPRWLLLMQTQLFWMRRREISLRITNGATRLQLFSMFATEVVMIVLGAYLVAVLMGFCVISISCS